MTEVYHSILAWVEASKYLLLFIGCIAEGPVVMMASGFIFHIGGFDFWPMYIALVSGDFVADIGWYSIGRFGARHLVFRFGKHFGITPHTIQKIEKRFQKYHEKILIISKLTMGFGFALVVLVVAGMTHVPFKKYVTLNLVGGFIWTGILVTVGYYFGNIYTLFTGPEKIVFAISGFVLFILAIRTANWYLSTKEI